VSLAMGCVMTILSAIWRCFHVWRIQVKGWEDAHWEDLQW
jgi:hypothetical protein